MADETVNANNLGSLTTAVSGNTPVLALANVTSVEDPFWAYSTTIDTARWNQSFPYQLLILDVSSGSPGTTTASFTLPIPPQELGVSTPFAISTQVTLGGIIEQHNGAPLRTINLSGTTGVWPGRGSQPPNQAPDISTAVLAGSVSSTVAAAASGSPTAGQGAVEPQASFATATGAGAETGYYQFRLLQQFLEAYVTAKKTDAGRNLRLAFAMWKDQAVYFVSPVSFEYKRSGASPWEYLYSLQFRAWKRVPLTGNDAQPVNSGGGASNANPQANVQTVAATQAAQTSLLGDPLINDFQGAVGPAAAATLIENMRQTSAWAKDQLGQVWTLADLPAAIVASLKGTVIAMVSNANLSPAGVDPTFSQLLQELGVSSGLAQTGLANPGGLGQNLNNLQGQDAAHQVNTIFANPSQFWNFFSSVNTADLQIPPSVQAKITAERQRLRNFTRSNFATILGQVQTSVENFADAVGAGDPTFNTTLGRPGVTTTRAPSDDDFEVMFQLNNFIMSLNRLAAYNNLSAVPSNPLDFAAGFYAGTDIPFQSSPGKFIVPVPYGATLETLAIKYLNDIDRWEELAVLNNLREPYVDEQGFNVPLLVNGSGNQVVVASVQGLEVNQLIYLSSAGQQRLAAHILSIVSINNGSYYVLTLDTPTTTPLGVYLTVQGASIHAFLPGTINSTMTMYIPSATPPPVPEFDTTGVPGINPYQQYFNIGGQDLLLTTAGDLVITPDGDTRWSLGLTNIIQCAWLAFNTPKGNLKRHREYGFPRLVGQSLADMNAQTLLQSAKNLFQGDPTFSGVQYASIELVGPVARVFLGVGLAGTSNIIPVAFDIH